MNASVKNIYEKEIQKETYSKFVETRIVRIKNLTKKKAMRITRVSSSVFVSHGLSIYETNYGSYTSIAKS